MLISSKEYLHSNIHSEFDQMSWYCGVAKFHIKLTITIMHFLKKEKWRGVVQSLNFVTSFGLGYYWLTSHLSQLLSRFQSTHKLFLCVSNFFQHKFCLDSWITFSLSLGQDLFGNILPITNTIYHSTQREVSVYQSPSKYFGSI